MSEFLAEIVTPSILTIIGSGLTFFLVNRVSEAFRWTKEYRTKSVDALFVLLDQAFDLIAEYYCKDEDPKVSEIATEQKIQWFQEKIAQTVAEISTELYQGDSLELDILIPEINDAMTGGDFQVRGRKASIRRIELFRDAATRLRNIVSVRRAHMLSEPIKLKSWFRLATRG